MVLTFTGTTSSFKVIYIQDKNWFFNGIDFYRITSSLQVNSFQHKNGSSMVLTFTGQHFP